MTQRSRQRTLTLAAGVALIAWHAAVLTAEPITLTISPVHPTSADRVRVRAHFDPDFCWPPLEGGWGTPAIVGRTIRVSEATPTLSTTPLPCQSAPADYETTLSPLVPGSWSIDFELESAGVRAALAFDITEQATELFLRDGRFEVRAWWRGRDGQAHRAAARQVTDGAGYLWFFDSSNLELTVKVLDGRAVNGKFWVFLASMTDVGYTVTVVDRSFVCGVAPCANTRVYEGVAGRNGNVLDTAAFSATRSTLAARSLPEGIEP